MRLTIPIHDLSETIPNSHELSQLLGGLPVTNAELTYQELSQLLHRCNRTQMDVATRSQVTAAFGAHVDSLLNVLQGQFAFVAIPLKSKPRRAATAARHLLMEMALAYKAIVQNIVDGGESPGVDNARVLIAALHGAIDYLGRYVMHHYIAYDAVPQGVWAELHYLYSLQEKQSAPAAGDSVQRTPAINYRRTLLLSLAAPYKLMQREAHLIYEKLGNWLKESGDFVVPWAVMDPPCYYVDLAADLEPRYGTPDPSLDPAQLRQLELTPLRLLVDHDIRNIKPKTVRGAVLANQTLSFGQRAERDMLTRLHKEWGSQPSRRDTRAGSSKGFTLAIGLSAAHNYVTGASRFLPELDEIKLYRDIAQSAKPQLSLVPIDHEPWRNQQEEDRLKSGVVKPRASVFDPESEAVDLWRNIYATKGRAELQANILYSQTRWQSVNESASGVALRLLDDTDQGVDLHVGELVAYQTEDNEGRWQIGALRWLRVATDTGVMVALMKLADSARGVAVRGVAGTGAGSEYFRSLITPAGEPESPESLLLVPPAIFDAGSLLAVNLGDRLIYVKLTKLTEGTRHYGQYAFQIVDLPASEREKIATIKQS